MTPTRTQPKPYPPKRFCGPLRPRLHHLLGPPAKPNPAHALPSKSPTFFHRARGAIRAACDLLALNPGDHILAPSYNCGTEIDALRHARLHVELYRIDRQAQPDLQDITHRITKKTKALYITHFFGFPQPLSDLKAIADKHHLYLIEDCALALFSSHHQTPLGSTGHVAVFNFPKTLPVLDGGALIINSTDLPHPTPPQHPVPTSRIWTDIRPLIKNTILPLTRGSEALFPMHWLTKTPHHPTQNRGMAILPVQCRTGILPMPSHHTPTDTTAAPLPDLPPSYYYDPALTTMAMTRLTAHMLTRINAPQVLAARRDNFQQYLTHFANIPAIRPLYNQLPPGACPLCFPIIIDNPTQIAAQLRQHRILDAKPWWPTFHRHLPWQQFPDAQHLKTHTLTLPVHQQLTPTQINHIAQTLKTILQPAPPTPTILTPRPVRGGNAPTTAVSPPSSSPSRRTQVEAPISKTTIAKRHLCFLLHHTGINALYRRLTPQPGIAVLLFHQMPKPQFTRCIDHLRRHYRIISLDQVLRHLNDQQPCPPNTIAITFDDGYQSNLTDNVPVLTQHNIPAAIFLTADLLDTKNFFWWDKVTYLVTHTPKTALTLNGHTWPIPPRPAQRIHTAGLICEYLKKIPHDQKCTLLQSLPQQLNVDLPPHAPESQQPMTYDQARQLPAHLMTLGGHTLTHPILTRLPADQAQHEITTCKTTLETKLQRPIQHFAYPNGEADDFNDQIKAYVAHAGFSSALTVIRGRTLPHTDPYAIPRVPIDNNATIPIIACTTSGLWQKITTLLHKN